MAFRRSSDDEHAFSSWKKRHAAALARAGLPGGATGSIKDWLHFLEHGGSAADGYYARSDPRLLADRDRVVALRDLILAWTNERGAVDRGGTPYCHVLPPMAFPWLYEVDESDPREGMGIRS